MKTYATSTHPNGSASRLLGLAATATDRAKRGLPLAPLIAGALVCLITGCQSPKPTPQTQAASPKFARPAVIYVSDFEIQAENIKHEDGMLSNRSGPIGRAGERVSGQSEDPMARARQVVALMTESLLKELAKAGFNANYLPPGSALPRSGWLLRGAFTEVQEGNRLRRSMVGFGQGQTDVKVLSAVHNLSEGPPKSLYEVAAAANSGNKVGAAPTLALSPYGAAVRFVRAGKDLDKNVKQAAAQIAAELAQQTQ